VIVDRYLVGTRLRLRRMQSEGGAPIFKFGQKVRPREDDPSVVMITNIYLSAAEYEVLATLPADVVEKTRWVVPLADGFLAVDEFGGRYAGLVLAEASFDDESAMRAFVPPSWCGEEVTANDRYSGGSLARFGAPTPSVPSVELVVVTEKDRSVLRRLLQLYLHDFSELLDTDVDPQGEFPYRYLDHYWTEPGRHPFLIQVEGAWAGFALVRACPHWDMAEFFVMRKYRRQGVGRAAAHLVFAAFPGTWEVRQLEANTGATRFWRAVIPYDFEELAPEEGVTQRFVVPGSGTPLADIS
jgi:predicted acetyltransferase/CYTH domain-containing protein